MASHLAPFQGPGSTGEMPILFSSGTQHGGPGVSRDAAKPSDTVAPPSGKVWSWVVGGCLPCIRATLGPPRRPILSNLDAAEKADFGKRAFW
eukprot:CAMPEP_0174306600 /NCGR_PEP_ID=MMETSP0810-20121108/563_1 /TAXON_ID=73025 ORGANISM="Eutreptiella gymnastica-like, Strain CCMP1594" /NCGR_SAMPLE_ID=MMETSP0810 /ASSEMBLY_ACC=CAM_ASM_000659 /LENGTH=91 /DNA_ID=CAMNT_0015413377 /DNA_START=656 /DNA_END=934 /DNA_ORIENTATION=+